MTEEEFRHAFSRPWRINKDASEPFPMAKRPAAVLICLNPSATGLSVIFTQRATHLKHHAGQVSFPGGKAEASDTSVIHTAFREAEEEIGLSTDALDVIGRLPDFRTISGFAVTPIIAKHTLGVCVPEELTIDKNEVGQAFEVPLAYLMNKENYYVQVIKRSSQNFPVYYLNYNGHLIWGATAGMLVHLRDHVLSHT